MKSGPARRTWAAAAVLVWALTPSCASRGKPAPSPTLDEARRSFEAGNYAKAIADCREAYALHPKAPAIRDGCARILGEIDASAGRALEARDFSAAIATSNLLLKSLPSFRPLERALQFSRGSLNERLRKGRNGASETQARRALAAGDDAKTVEIGLARHRVVPADSDWTRVLVALLEEIKRKGDDLLMKRDFARAGGVYAVLAKRFPELQRLQASVSFSRDPLEAGIRTCRSELNNQALEQYRKENLAEAISLWKLILAFDPEDPAAKRSIETASAQLKNIKK